MWRWLSTGASVLILVLVLFGAEPIGQASQSSAGSAAADLLKQVPVPPKARPVPNLASDLLQHPLGFIPCARLVDKARFLVLNGSTLQSVSTFLTSHHPTGWAGGGSGAMSAGTTEIFESTYFPSARPAPHEELMVTYAGVRQGQSGDSGGCGGHCAGCGMFLGTGIEAWSSTSTFDQLHRSGRRCQGPPERGEEKESPRCRVPRYAGIGLGVNRWGTALRLNPEV